MVESFAITDDHYKRRNKQTKQLSSTLIGGLALGTFCLVNAGLASNAQNPGVNAVQKSAIMSKAAGIHVPFITNEGQIENDDVRFYARTFGGTVFVTKDGEIVYSLPKYEKKEQGEDGEEFRARNQPNQSELTGVMVLHEHLVGARTAKLLGQKPAVTRVNYFIGSDTNKWKSNIAAYDTVSIGEVYDDIELNLQAHGNNVEKGGERGQPCI